MKLLAGSDAPIPAIVPGFSLIDELRFLVSAGLTPYEALAAATRNPAEFLGHANDFGTIAVGKEADLILLAANPLDDINNLVRREGVMVRGKWMTQSELQKMLDDLAPSYAGNHNKATD